MPPRPGRATLVVSYPFRNRTSSFLLRSTPARDDATAWSTRPRNRLPGRASALNSVVDPSSARPGAALRLDRSTEGPAELECAREPIRIPGAIQPHGRLLLLDPALGIAGRSRDPSCGADTTPRHLGDILDPPSCERIAARLADAHAPADDGAPPLPILVDGIGDRDGRNWIGQLVPPNGPTPAMLELEPAPDPASRAAAAREVLASLNRAVPSLAAASTVPELASAAAASLRDLTGFDRVMLYRFLPDWSGEVLGESLAHDGISSFAGLRFPASDIPAQARDLYRIAGLRMIPDAQAEPIPLETGAPTPDLAAASLRAVSPIHLRYLVNMGVRASMSVAIVTRDGSLWGLLACHHESAPLVVTHEARGAARTLARTLGWRLDELRERDRLATRTRILALADPILSALADPEVTVETALLPHAAVLFDAVPADALLLLGLSNGTDLAPGSRHASLATRTFAARLDTLSSDAIVVAESIDFEKLGDVSTALAEARLHGLLAIRLAEPRDDAPGTWIAWLRHELPREVVWAGNPEKSVRPNPDALVPLTPRRSFAAWHAEMRGRSAPFTHTEIAAAEAIAAILRRGLLRRAVAIERANGELVQRNEDIRFFADAAVHDLREPLWQIQVFAGLLRQDLSAPDRADDDPELPRMAGIIEQSAGRMRQLLDELNNFASVGRKPAALTRQSLHDVVTDAAAEFEERLRNAGAALSIEIPNLTLVCDAPQLRRVFQNLLSNAIKYRSPDRPLAIRIEALENEGRIEIGVTDNGLGFDPSDAAIVFEPFRRLAGHAERVSDGFGLGLAICRRIVEAHAGRIGAVPRPGQGVRFELSIPVEGPAA